MKSRKEHSQCFELDADPDEVLKCLKEEHRVGVILRGVAGSGKSTLANQLFDDSNNKHTIISADGSDYSQITKMVRNAISDDMKLIVVDAENIERSIIKTLAGVLISSSYECYVMEPKTSWKYDANECEKQSSSDDSVDEIQRKIDVICNSSIMWNHVFSGNVVISNFHDDDSCTSVSTPSSIQSSSSTAPTRFFSLAPTPKMTTLKTVETNVSMECIIFELAGHESRKNCSGYRLVEEETFTANEKNTDRTPPSQSTQTESVFHKDDQVTYQPLPKLLRGTDEDREFSLLKLFMPEVDLGVLDHYHRILGFQQVFTMFHGLGFVQTTDELPEDSQEIREEISFMECYTVSNRNVDEELEIRSLQRAGLHFNENVFIPDETGNDEEIARALQDEEGNFQQSQEDDKLVRLKKCFPRTDESIIAYALEVYMTFEEARLSLIRDYGELEATNSKSNSYSKRAAVNCQAQSKPEKSTRERNNHFLNSTSVRARQSLSEVQREALNIRAALEYDRVSNTFHVSSTEAKYHNAVMEDRVARRSTIVSKKLHEIDTKIRDAHQNPFFLDLHYMSVDGAIRLVEEAVEAVRYYIKYLKNSSRRLTVVTGTGNNSKECAKIKPKVLEVLLAKKISHRMVNDGCVEIKL